MTDTSSEIMSVLRQYFNAGLKVKLLIEFGMCKEINQYVCPAQNWLKCFPGRDLFLVIKPRSG